LSKIVDHHDGDVIDIGLVLWFPKPNSYTGEDVCELHLHGSRAVVTRILDVLGKSEGLRPAEPGEFTRRAVENKKLTLMQAECLPELIKAQTDQQRKLALQGLAGGTIHRYKRWIEELVRILAHLEASIDFGEDELLGEQRVVQDCIAGLMNLHLELKEFIDSSSRCRDIVQCGSRVSILGRPNAGKSTLMNLICRQQKSIVSDLSGTTRDVIEHPLELDGYPLILSDTAGLKNLSESSVNTDDFSPGPAESLLQQHNFIELQGIKRAVETAKRSHIILYILDATQLMTDQGFESTSKDLENLLRILDGDIERQGSLRYLHLILNKIDLCANEADKEDSYNVLEARAEKLEVKLKNAPILAGKKIDISAISCKTNRNLESVIKKISVHLRQLSSRSSSDGYEGEARSMDYVNERHLSLLHSTLRHLDEAHRLDLATIDEMAQHVRESVDYLSRIIGNVDSDDVIDVIFRDFCIGK